MIAATTQDIHMCGNGDGQVGVLDYTFDSYRLKQAVRLRHETLERHASSIGRRPAFGSEISDCRTRIGIGILSERS